MKVSNGYVMGFLCGYMKNAVNPTIFGYHRGYTVSKEAAQAGAVKPAKPCECSKPECPECAKKPKKALAVGGA